MKHEIRVVDKEKGVVQVTTTDERWYQNAKGEYLPSSTWVASYYPKGLEYMKWLASKGWEEAESAKTNGGNRGSKVHHAVEILLQGGEILFSDQIKNGEGRLEDITVEEWYCIMTFAKWYEETNITKIIAVEVSGVGSLYGGTIDFVCEIDGEVWVIDFKTSARVWPAHRIQVSSYKYLLPHIAETKNIDIDTVKLGILQLGYNKTKKGYKLTEIEDKYDLFMAAYAMWTEEVSQKTPMQKDYPLVIKL